MNTVNTCIVIGGPTASGKTSLAIELALHYETQILSADSRQCYREMNIGVAKPTPAQLSAVPHHFINSHSITDDLTAAAYEAYALNVLDHLFSKTSIAIVVGGTGLYIRALLSGLDVIPSIPEAVRQAIREAYLKNGMAWLQQAIAAEDPEYFATGERQNPQRMMRALEVMRATGSSIRTFQQSSGVNRSFQVIPLRLTLPREELYQRIDERVDQMMAQGLLEEVRGLLPYRQLNALQTVGYRELFDFLDGHCNLEQAVAHIKLHTRNYAKRQETWFRKYLDGSTFEANQLEEMILYINDNLQRGERP